MASNEELNIAASPDEMPVIRLNPVSLGFAGQWKHLEPDFLRDYASESIKHIRLAFLLGIFFYSIFGILDAILVPEKLSLLWFIRFGVVCPVILGGTLLSYWSGFQKWAQQIIFFIVIVAGGGISVMVATTPPPVTYSYYAGVILVLMMGYGFVKARFLWASAAGWINVIIYEVVAIGIVPTPGPILINNNFFFISANLIGMFSCYAFEYYTRKDFFMARMLSDERKKVTQLNLDLEKKVDQRTSELQKAYDTLQKETKDREALQSQLLQAQKMESVGRLAGGVAHDFNNILSIIIGFSEIAMEKVTPEDPLHEDLQEILTAAKRSRDITRQLLAFARKETIAPVLLDLNTCIEGMLKVLRRLIGEDINLIWRPSIRELPVLMDRSQLEQILANLCVNARDAIADIGEITIETDTKVVAEGPVDMDDFKPGEYVVLTVRDNGKGMHPEMLENIFEPFYTTKGVGEGTGLGLATIHGITQQNKGFINVISTPGSGTTFEIHLPKHRDMIAEDPYQEDLVSIVRGNGETLLVVEDEVSIVKLTSKILRQQGYSVIAARTPAEALKLAKINANEIDLLLTDVVMPGMNGKELARQIQALNSHIKCLYMSGYTANIIENRGVLDGGLDFIQKPFTSRSIAAKVRAVLDAAAE